jgi:hypothetical protein
MPWNRHMYMYSESALGEKVRNFYDNIFCSL